MEDDWLAGQLMYPLTPPVPHQPETRRILPMVTKQKMETHFLDSDFQNNTFKQFDR
jgi:hypothetical protein